MVVVAGSFAAADETKAAGGAADFDLVAVFERNNDLAVYGETDLIVFVTAFGLDGDGKLAVGRNHNGSYRKFDRTDGRENKSFDARVNDGSAGGKRMTGGTRGRGDDYTVRFEVQHLSLVDSRVQGDKSSKVALINDGLI